MTFCYECHEELLHNPVLLPNDISRFGQLARQRGLSEDTKPKNRGKIAQRIMLFHEVIARGLKALHDEMTGDLSKELNRNPSRDAVA
jgi:hypothetical protein